MPDWGILWCGFNYNLRWLGHKVKIKINVRMVLMDYKTELPLGINKVVWVWNLNPNWAQILLKAAGGIKTGSPATLFTGNAGWLCPFNVLTAFSSPSAVMWQAEMSSSRSRGMVMVVETSSGRSSSWSRLPDIRSSVRPDWSFNARRSGVREEEPKLRPHTDTEELPSCTSHSRVTRLFSSAGGNQDTTLQDGSPKCVW